MARRRYTDQQRAEVLDIAVARGSVSAARESGVPVGTVASWLNRAGRTGERTAHAAATAAGTAAAWQVRRAELGQRMAEDAWKARDAYLAALDAGRANDARTLVITTAVLIDKADKLTGMDAAPALPPDPEARADAIIGLMDRLAAMERLPDEEPAEGYTAEQLGRWLAPRPDSLRS